VLKTLQLLKKLARRYAQELQIKLGLAIRQEIPYTSATISLMADIQQAPDWTTSRTRAALIPCI